MKKLLGLTLIIGTIVLLTGCDLFGERRYGEGDVVRVLINPSGDQSTQFFMNLRIFNDSDEARQVRIGGFEYRDGDDWILIPPTGEHEWMFNKWVLQPSGHDSDTFNTTMQFNYWLNPNYPTLGEFRAVVRVYDLNGNYQFTQESNTRTLEHFRFE